MAQRRMFSPAIVCSDAFLDMPSSGRDLYYQLGMYADDDGFVNPRKIMRMLGSSEDDLKILIAKRFVLPFPSGVLVIKHWKINNLVRKDWYRPTQYTEELMLLTTKDNGSYTEIRDKIEVFVTEPLPTRQRRLGKVRLGKVSIDNTHQQADEVMYSKEFLSFWETYPKKVGKGAAWRVWEKIRGLDVGLVLTAVARQKTSQQWVKDDGQFIPHPATWLNQRRWEDEETIKSNNFSKYDS